MPVVMQSRKERILVLGFDPGTTSFKVAWLGAAQVYDKQGNARIERSSSQLPVPLSQFPGFARFDSPTVPTALAYIANGELFKWGHNALSLQDHQGYIFVPYWKLGVRTSSTPAARQLRADLEEKAEHLGAVPEKFIEDFFRAVRQHIFEDEKSILFKHLGGKHRLEDFKYIDLVIGLPPGWPEQEHLTFSGAATLGFGISPKIRVFTVSETECVLRQWATDEWNREKLKTGDRLIVPDLGGGTACVSMYRWIKGLPTSERIDWEHNESHSMDVGSETVTEAFLADFGNRLKKAGLTLTPKLRHKARKEFDERKMSIGDESQEPDWCVEVAGLDRDDAEGFSTDNMRFEGKTLLGYFKDSQDPILEKIGQVVNHIPKDQNTSIFCVVAGAYGKNVIFQRRLEALNMERKYNMQISFAHDWGESVARGACLARVEGEFCQSSGSRYSIGLLIYDKTKIVEKKFPDTAKTSFDNGKSYDSPFLEWKLKKGEEMKANNRIDVDGIFWRRRYFSAEEELVIHDTICTSESHPGNETATYLRHRTNNPDGWELNRRDLLSRGIEIKVFEITCDPGNIPASLDDLSFDRTKKKWYLNYKYYFDVGFMDLKVYIKLFFKTGKTHWMSMNHEQILVKREQESTTLLTEHEHVAQDMRRELTQMVPPMISQQDAASSAIDHHSRDQQLLEEQMEDVSNVETALDSGSSLAAPRHAMQGPGSPASTFEMNQLENTRASHSGPPLTPASPNSFRRPRPETLAGLRTPLVNPRRRGLSSTRVKQTASKHRVNPFEK